MAPSRAMRPLQTLCTTCTKRRLYTKTPPLHAAESNLPRIAQPTFWSSLIPKPFRKPSDPIEAAERAERKALRSKEWNPATIFIILGVLVGSNAIQLIALRNEMLNFTRKTDAKLALLREVIGKIKAGESVDVRAALGTGDAEAEAEWEEVIRELENTDGIAEGRRKREEKRVARLREGGGEKKREAAVDRRVEDDAVQGKSEARPKFLM